MVLESLGTVKAANALTAAVMGLASAAPPLIQHSALATQQLVTAATPVVTQGIAVAGAGLTLLGVAIAKSTAALKVSLGTATPAKAAGGAATASAVKGATAGRLISTLRPPVV